MRLNEEIEFCCRPIHLLVWVNGILCKNMIIILLNGCLGHLSIAFISFSLKKKHTLKLNLPSAKSQVWHCYSTPGSFKESPKMRRCSNEFCSDHLRLKRRNTSSIKYSEISKWKQVYWMSKTINSNLAAYHCQLTTESIKTYTNLASSLRLCRSINI